MPIAEGQQLSAIQKTKRAFGLAFGQMATMQIVKSTGCPKIKAKQMQKTQLSLLIELTLFDFNWLQCAFIETK